MTRRRRNGSVLLAAITCLLAGCGVSTNVQNPPPPATKAIAIAFQPAPPTSVLINATASMTAVVSNDPSNAGVDWSLKCQNASSCGLLSSAHTSSGQPQTYTPPSTLSSNSQSVTIVAFATADHSKNVLAGLNVSAFANVLSGAYVLQTNGVDSSGNPYQRVGVVVLDGNGGVTSGEQTVNFTNQSTGLQSIKDPVIGGSYFVGGDGRGTIAIDTADVNVGQAGTCLSGGSNIPCGIETFSLVVLSGSQVPSPQVLLTKADDQSLGNSSNETSIGRMDLQAGTAAPTGGYAFVTHGTDINLSSIAVGGVLKISGHSVFSSGSVADLAYNDGSGTVSSPKSTASGTVSAPNAFGAVNIKLTTGFSPLQFTGYIIDTSRMALIESDDTSGAGFGVTAGLAISQGSATGTFNTASFTGKFAFGMFGPDSSLTPFSYLSSAGLFTSSGGGLLTNGYLDEFQYQSGVDLQVSDAFSGTYAVDSTGRVDTNSSIQFSSNGQGPELVFYLTGTGGPALVLDTELETGIGGAGIATGIAYPVTTGASFSGLYGLTSTQNFLGTEADSAGEITANGTAKTASGILDMNIDFSGSFSPQLGTTLTDGFQASAISGRLTGTWTDASFPSPFSTTLAVAYYPVDSGHGFVTEIDGGGAGANPGNLTLAYYTARTPVCTGCP